MALIRCYECKKEISSLAPTCPGCGAPRKDSTPFLPMDAAGTGSRKSWSLAKDRLYTIKECAALLSRSDVYVRRLIKSGEVNGFTLNSKGFSHVAGRSINQFLKGRSSGTD